MKQELKEILNDLAAGQLGDQDELSKLSGKGLPDDYMQFMLDRNGGDGFIGKEENYIILYSAYQVLTMNPYYDEEFARRVTVVGSDGGGMLYGYDPIMKNFFDTDNSEFTAEEVHYCGPAFLDLINYLANKIV
jgi:hypothetical protein